MANIFPKWSNTVPLKIVVALVLTVTAATGGVWYYFSPSYTRVGFMPTQPVPYSHAIHVG